MTSPGGFDLWGNAVDDEGMAMKKSTEGAAAEQGSVVSGSFTNAKLDNVGSMDRKKSAAPINIRSTKKKNKVQCTSS